ncbi:hypothetical protein BCV71DRAFT_236845 [Rhizopus microsporus]|uniref:Uncharacterized protein n=1 Tax=Rhizopus microsporus TaxID=58291 RepID=A0A1X0RWC4_RHIZD|nr:hypothetical protein BCV71DRAFT_236845 [Rhizopus microsporus]
MNLALYCVCFWVENGFRDDTAYPDVMSEIFWSHCYRTVARDEGHVVRSVTFSSFIQCIQNCFNIFDICRKNPNNGQYLYDIPEINRLHGNLATSCTTSVITIKHE